MSNMSTFNASKSPVNWGRPTNNPNLIQNSGLQMKGHAVQFQMPQQIFTNNMGMQQQQQQQQQQNLGLGLQQTVLSSNQIFQQVAPIAYPNPRVSAAFQTQAIAAMATNTSTKQRFFTGTVTKVHDNFGFVDEDVFFQTSACVKDSNPTVGDRVLVEASYNPNMPFKWNATRIQVLPTSAPPSNRKNYHNDANFLPKNPRKSRVRERSRDDDNNETERKRRRGENREQTREKDEKKASPARRRSRTPRRRRSRIVPRYMVQIPKINLELKSADVLEIRRRYNNLYVPSDFFCSCFRWVEAFPPDKPFVLSKQSLFHIMHKDVDSAVENDAVLEPPDADYVFSVKVMLMSVPGMDEIFQKCCAMAEDKDRKDRDSEDRDYIHPTRLIQFLVGLRGKNETMAIGGPWSPSLDGDSPATDPSVLIRTAIRTCKALTGIDLSPCTQWYRFLELYYHRSESTHKGKAIPSRVETVVLFLPDVWSCLPTRLEWDSLHQTYRRRLEAKLSPDQDGGDEHPANADEKKDEIAEDGKTEPTHYSQLEPKILSVNDLRTELRARNINSKGLKSQLVARLSKALKSEAEDQTVAQSDTDLEAGGAPSADEKKLEVEEKKIDEKEKAQLEKRHTLPDQPHIIVHPSRTAKSGKFDCTSTSLSVLLDYCSEDTKEHSFEVSLFAELFNEMLMRDFGFNIYKALYELPDKPKDDKKPHKEEEVKKEEKKNSEDEEDDCEEDAGKKRTDKKKKERPRMFTKDRTLLLSFVYFDQTHCGYIFEKDMEDLLFTLGLNLSRAQVRKLVGKVITRDSLHYRKLTDKPKDDDFIVIDDSERDVNVEDLAAGNKRLLSVFNSDAADSNIKDDNTGLVKFRGSLVDIEKLMVQLERSDRARVETETRMIELKAQNAKLTEKYAKSSSGIKTLNVELKEVKENLHNSDESLIRMTACCKLFQTTLSDIRDKIDPVLKSTGKDNRKDNEKKHEESKSRWEKSCKETAKDKEDSLDFNVCESVIDANVENNVDVSS